MSVPVLAFFNNKGGVGKTFLAYHLSAMYADLGLRVLAADLDPQANLSSHFLDDESLSGLWEREGEPTTVYEALRPLLERTGDVLAPGLTDLGGGLALLPGDISLSSAEDELAGQWDACMSGNVGAFRVISAFWRIMQAGAEAHEAHVVVMDIGPNLGAINRSALVAADHVVIPLAADLFSLRGLSNLGPRLAKWRGEWRDRLERKPDGAPVQPAGAMRPSGYVVMQPQVRLDRPVYAYARWADRVPSAYREALSLEGQAPAGPRAYETDPFCLGVVRHYGSLVPMAQEAHKPIFQLRAADGALGAHGTAAQRARGHFEVLARSIAGAIGLEVPA